MPKFRKQSPTADPRDAVPLVSLYRELAVQILRIAESNPSVGPYGTGAIFLARRLVAATDAMARALANHVPAAASMLLAPAVHGAPLPPPPMVAARLRRYAHEITTRYADTLRTSGVDTREVVDITRDIARLLGDEPPIGFIEL